MMISRPQFLEHVAADLRGGRQSWRVLSLLWSIAVTVAVAARLLLR